jgi:hypothetical protein
MSLIHVLLGGCLRTVAMFPTMPTASTGHGQQTLMLQKHVFVSINVD